MPRALQAEDTGLGLCAQHAEQAVLCVSERTRVHTDDRLLLQENTCGQESGAEMPVTTHLLPRTCYHAYRASMREHDRAQKGSSFLPKYKLQQILSVREK